MSDELLLYYNRELQFIRRMGAEFAEANPLVANNLRMEGDRVEDPHVARLIEAFALLGARIRSKLDDEFPEITDALLGILYPHYLAPVPSTAIVQFTLDRDQGKLTDGFVIPRGTQIETVLEESQPVQCQFRTSYPVELWPIEITAVNMRTPPFTCPQTPKSSQAAAVLEVQLRTLDSSVAFAEMPIDRLRFFLNEQPPFVYQLYELLLNDTIEVAVASSPTDRDRVLVDVSNVQPVGFERDEGLLEYPQRSFPGYRLLTEFFVVREKFLFFDLSGLSQQAFRRDGNTLHIYFFFGRQVGNLVHHISKAALQLGCSPVVNLFSTRAEPIRLTHTETEYHVKVRQRRPDAFEIYSINRVVATSPDNEVIEFHPFYCVQHAASQMQKRAFWYAVRRPAGYQQGKDVGGTELYLSLVNLGFEPTVPADWTLEIETTCLNRNLPRGLPFGGGKPKLQAALGPPMEIKCLTRPTATLRPALRHGARWRTMSHLSLNHLSLIDNAEGADALREMLKLYDFSDSAETQRTIDGIASVQYRPIVRRFSWNGPSTIGRGSEIIVVFDEDKVTSGCVFLLASVLERFFALYSSINSFTSLVARSSQREGVIRKWDPRAGEKALL